MLMVPFRRLVQRLQLQNHSVNSSTALALAGVTTYVQLKMLMDSTLGVENDDVISDLLHAFTPIPYSASSNDPIGKGLWADVEARYYHRQENLAHLQRFFESTDNSAWHPWLHPGPIHEPPGGVKVILQAATSLEDHWASVSKELEELKALQAEVTKKMSDMIPFCEDVAMQIDTTYPEVILTSIRGVGSPSQAFPFRSLDAILILPVNYPLPVKVLSPIYPRSLLGRVKSLHQLSSILWN